MTEARYVYAILSRDASPLPDVGGLQESAVTLVQHRDLCAATSVIDPSNLQATPENALRHEAVVEALQRVGPLLPVRFGTVLADTPAVIRALSEHHDTLVADLVRLGGTAEYGLTLLWGRPQAGEGAEGTAPRGPEDRDDSEPAGPGTRYLQARLMDHRRDAALRARAAQVVDAVEGLVRPHALDSRWTIRPGPRIAARAAYLLHHGTEEAFQQAFEASRAAHPELRFLLSGPWPPYNFVTAPESSEASVEHGELQTQVPTSRR